MSEARRELPLYVVDAFTAQPFSGNPAAVCVNVEADALPQEEKQRIAAEMNLSETAFVERCDPAEAAAADGAPCFRIQWLTPTTEVPLCGHATLATSHALFSHVLPRDAGDRVQFISRHSGALSVRRRSDGTYALNFPMNKPAPVPAPGDAEAALMRALSVDAAVVQHLFYSETTAKLLLHVASVDHVLAAAADVPAMLAVRQDAARPVRGVIVTAAPSAADAQRRFHDEQYTCVSRYFAPWVGIPEDPVTGAAHTVLAPYWCDRLNTRSAKAYQASARGGTVLLEVDWDGARVELSGHATLVVRGSLLL